MSVPPLVIAGYDGREHGRDAIALAAILARELDARVRVVHVYPDFTDAADIDQELREGARRVLAGAPMDVVAGIDSGTDAVQAHSAAHGLQRLAEESGATLLVIGSTHNGVLGRAMTGSVANRLLHGAPCTVAVAPAGYADSSPRVPETIAVAYDGSDESRVALDEAGALASNAGARLLVVTVVEPLEYAWSSAGLAYPVQDIGVPPEAVARRLLDEARAAVTEGVDVETRVCKGLAADSIRAACAEGVDLLVMGSRGYGAVRRVLLGGVSSRVVRDAPCPVLVVPGGREQEQTDRPRESATTTS